MQIFMMVALKKKSDLTEMVICGCINGKLNNKTIGDISINKANTILKENNINIKTLPVYGNISKRKKDIKPYIENNKCSIKVDLE